MTELEKARDVALRWAHRVKLVDARADLARMALEGRFDAILPARSGLAAIDGLIARGAERENVIAALRKENKGLRIETNRAIFARDQARQDRDRAEEGKT